MQFTRDQLKEIDYETYGLVLNRNSKDSVKGATGKNYQDFGNCEGLKVLFGSLSSSSTA